jgi:hypothetical protein
MQNYLLLRMRPASAIPSIESRITGYLKNVRDWYPTFSVDRLKYVSGVGALPGNFGMIHVHRR